MSTAVSQPASAGSRPRGGDPEAADWCGQAAQDFWDGLSGTTVSRLRLPAGGTVLDLCCGAGASAIPAAHAVGADGRVLGIDMAAPSLELAQARAAREGLVNVDFRCGDATQTGLPDGAFDAVVCVFGVFYAPDMTAFVQEMWRLVRPGGVLAVTTWGPGLFEPANSCFWRCVDEVEPALFNACRPWDVLTTPTALADLFARAGVPGSANAVPGRYVIGDPGRFWDMTFRAGYRSTLEALSPEQRVRVRARLVGELRSRGVTALRTDTVAGTARRPGPEASSAA